MAAQIEAVDVFAFDNSYARLPNRFFARPILRREIVLREDEIFDVSLATFYPVSFAPAQSVKSWSADRKRDHATPPDLEIAHAFLARPATATQLQPPAIQNKPARSPGRRSPPGERHCS
jgi:hypothetical protein